jgi:hypothetical protein
MEKLKIWTSRLLLAFVIFSIGFAFGKMAGRQGAIENTTENGIISPPPAGVVVKKVVVYYFHATFRCPACNLAEKLGENLVKNELASKPDGGILEWKPVNFQENDALAEKYNVAGNMIVVSRQENGKEVRSIRLDRVLELVENEEEFLNYVRTGILECMEDK